jgi:hypothetical protein
VAVDLVGGGPHTLRDEALKLGVDRAVVLDVRIKTVACHLERGRPYLLRNATRAGIT